MGARRPWTGRACNRRLTVCTAEATGVCRSRAARQGSGPPPGSVRDRILRGHLRRLSPTFAAMAGSGSYEPGGPGLSAVAVEPSAVMRAQRGSASAPVVSAVAERLPVADGNFDAAAAVLALHHWSARDPRRRHTGAPGRGRRR